MKPLLLFLLAALLLPAAAPGYEVVLSNAEDMDFHYALDPPELEPFDSGSSIFPAVVHDYLTRAEGGPMPFEVLPAGASRRLAGLSEGTHLLVGFFIEPGRPEFPVRVVALQAGSGLPERHYRIYGAPALVYARPGQGRLSAYAAAAAPRGLAVSAPAGTVFEGTPAAPGATDQETEAAGEPGPATPAAEVVPEGSGRVRIDHRYERWETVPALLVFPADHRPTSFTRERVGGELEVLPIGESRRWGTGGTPVHEVKVVRDQGTTYLYLSTHEAISEDVSIFLYFHASGSGAVPNRLTLELSPRRTGSPGLVVLWQENQEPVMIGELATGSFFLEARVADPVLLPHLESLPGLSYFDLTSCYFDRRELAYEEFYFGSLEFAQIATVGTSF